MVEPTAEELEVYRRVKGYLDERVGLCPYGYLGPADSVYACGEAEVVIGGPAGPLDDPVAKYEEGYYEASMELVESAAGRIHAEWTVFPIIFVSRHALELSLKKLLVEVVNPVPEDVGKEHNIGVLWELLLTRLQERYPCAVPQNAALITKIISQLTEIDPESMNSRYATKKDFKTLSIATARSLSLRNLQAIVGKLYNEFYNILHALEEYRSAFGT